MSHLVIAVVSRCSLPDTGDLQVDAEVLLVELVGLVEPLERRRRRRVVEVAATPQWWRSPVSASNIASPRCRRDV
jgi:hypothetical protein